MDTDPCVGHWTFHMFSRLCFPLVLLVAGCGKYPRDIGGTLDRIEERGTVRVGMLEIRSVDEPLTRDFLRRVEQSTRARLVIERGPAELELARLDQGAIDLVPDIRMAAP